MLVGRGEQLDLIEAALDRAAGQSGSALVLRGTAGMGKSALLERAVELARERNARVFSVTGVQAETRLPYAALRQLLDPLRRMPQTPVAPYAAGLAALELLSEAGEDGPLCLIVDDAQWIDRQSWEALTFVARRLPDEPLFLLAAFREGDEAIGRLAGAGLPEARIGPLADDDAKTLLDRVASDLSPALRARVLAEAGGNPLGLIELGTTAGRHGGPGELPLTARLEQTYATIVGGLPAPTRSLVLVTAVCDGDHLDEVLAAAGVLAGGPVMLETLQPAITAGLITTDGATARFRHPLIRSAVRQTASLADRLAAHDALARVLPPDSDRATWHRAAATVGVDEALAQRLGELAARVGRNGAFDTALTAWKRAAELSTDTGARVDWLMWAVNAAREVGDRGQVEGLLRTIGELDLDDEQQIRLVWMRESALGQSWSGETRARLMEVAERTVRQGDDALALDFLTTAALRNWWAPQPPERRAELVALVERLAIAPDDPRMIKVLGLVAPLERAERVAALLAERLQAPPSHPDRLNELVDAASAIGHLPAAELLVQDAVAGSRLNGHVHTLSFALKNQMWVAAHAGQVRLAIVAGNEARSMSEEEGDLVGVIIGKLCVGLAEALRGDADIAWARADEAEQLFHSGVRHPFVPVITLVRGVAMLGAGRPVDAFEQFRRLFDEGDSSYHPYVRLFALAHLAEAAKLADRVADLEPIARACADLALTAPWPILIIHLRYANALLADDAEQGFRDALATDLTGWPFERARIQLAFGEWLRRRRRPTEARPVLRAALETLTALGVAPWAERARRELRATGETVRAAEDRTGKLTAQELQIAQLAARGLSNQEIARQLYVSPRTVSTHLYRIYPKIGVRSRSGLAGALRGS